MTSDFNPLTFIEEIERLAAADGWSINHLKPTETILGPVRPPWFHRARPGKLDTERLPRLYVSSGIHGDETSGPLAIKEMLANREFFLGYDVTLFPVLNPSGLALRKRENGVGIDLNRDYRNTQSAEISAHIEVFKTLGQFDAALMLHEDWEGVGAYLFELNEGLPSGLGRRVIEAMSHHVPIDERPIIDEMAARKGVICREDLVESHGQIEDREQWPEAIYLTVNHSNVTLTTETPMPFPIEKRVAAQIAAVERVLRELDEVSLSAEAWTK